MIDLANQAEFLLPQLNLCDLEKISRHLTRQLESAERRHQFERERQLLLKKLTIVELELKRTEGK